MEDKLNIFLRRLREHGRENNIPNVSDEVALFLNMLIAIKQPQRILEIGCANGFSTIWMAEAAQKYGGKIIALDHSRPTFEQAQENIRLAGFENTTILQFGDALDLIPDFTGKFDFVFVDGEKASYLDFWNVLQPHLKTGAILVFDDMIAFPKKTGSFLAALKGMKNAKYLLLPVEKNDGILLMIKD